MTDVEIEIESELEDLEIRRCSELLTPGNYYHESKNYQQLY